MASTHGKGICGPKWQHLCKTEGGSFTWNSVLHVGLPQLEEALGLFRDALAGGSAKAQWNACYAVGSLLRTSTAAAALAASPVWRELLLLLSSVAASCLNFKVHI